MGFILETVNFVANAMIISVGVLFVLDWLKYR